MQLRQTFLTVKTAHGGRLILVFSMLAVLCIGAASETRADTIEFAIPATGTFLRTNQDPQATTPLIINLTSLSIAPGSNITIEQLGALSFGTNLPDNGTATIGVFSSNSTLLTSDQLNRIPGAIAAAVPPILTSPTLFGGLPTDIAQDFEIATFDGNRRILSVLVPQGAEFLFVTANDGFYGDNSDPNNDFRVRLTFTPTSAVPEPTTMLLLATGLAGVAARVRGSRKSFRKIGE